MSPEAVTVEIGGLEVRAAEGAEIVSDLYSPEGSWSLPIAPGSIPIKGAELARVRIGDQLELVGLVGRMAESYDHQSHTLRLSGKTLAGLMKTSCITDFGTPPNTLDAADSVYTASVPYLNRLPVEFHEAAYEKNAQHHAADVGDTVFNLLSEYARNRALLLWFRPDGTRVYGKAVTEGEPEYRIDARAKGRGSVVRDWDELHSRVILVSDGKEGHSKVSVSNTQAPVERPLVAAFNGYSSDLEKQAKEYLRQEKVKSLQLEYTVAGFSQSGKPWRVNTLCQVEDSTLGISGTFVVVRTLKRWSRTEGSTTTLTLGPRLEDPFQAFQKHGRHLRHRGGMG